MVEQQDITLRLAVRRSTVLLSLKMANLAVYDIMNKKFISFGHRHP